MAERWEELFDQARAENGKGNAARAEELVALTVREADGLSHDTHSYSSAQCGFALWRYVQERFAEAEVFQQRYIEAERRLGVGGRELANMTMWLADMQRKQAKLNDARQTIEKAIRLYPGGYLTELSQAYDDLASVLSELGDAAGASGARKKSVELAEEWDEQVKARTAATL